MCDDKVGFGDKDGKARIDRTFRKEPKKWFPLCKMRFLREGATWCTAGQPASLDFGWKTQAGLRLGRSLP